MKSYTTGVTHQNTTTDRCTIWLHIQYMYFRLTLIYLRFSPRASRSISLKVVLVVVLVVLVVTNYKNSKIQLKNSKMSRWRI